LLKGVGLEALWQQTTLLGAFAVGLIGLAGTWSWARTMT
jgi:hypothetical protein